MAAIFEAREFGFENPDMAPFHEERMPDPTGSDIGCTIAAKDPDTEEFRIIATGITDVAQAFDLRQARLEMNQGSVQDGQEPEFVQVRFLNHEFDHLAEQDNTA